MSSNIAFWTNERCDMLRKLVGEGVPYGEIGQRIGCSRNAAIGKAMRLKIAGSKPRRVKKKKAYVRKGRRIMVRQPAVQPQALVVDPTLQQTTVAETTTRTITVFNNGRARKFEVQPVQWVEENSATVACWDCFNPEIMCAWPVRADPHQFCGAPRSPGSRYCARHRAASHRPTPEPHKPR